MENNSKKKKKFAKKLLHKYRLIILNQDTFEEKLSFKLTRLNVFVAVGLLSIILIAGTTVLIAFTPLREYIPGYSSAELKKTATALVYKSDSLQHALQVKNQYYASIAKVLKGELPQDSLRTDTVQKTAASINPDSINFAPSELDSLLRKKVEEEEKFNVFDKAISKSAMKLLAPIRGKISDKYDLKNKHYAVDIVVAENSPVKATADGTVIFAEWTAATGYVMIIEHSYGLISVYKHNSSLAKEQGDLVKAGEVIATTGSTGELSTGPHLHFELWSDGYPVNPTDFLEFE